MPGQSMTHISYYLQTESLEFLLFVIFLSSGGKAPSLNAVMGVA